MNYYPNNVYSNYGYGQQYPMGTNNYTSNTQPQQSIPQTNVISGKIVDGEELVRATEVPFGGYGVFPKADLSEIYIKSWSNNGMTQVITYRPIVQEKKGKEETNLLILEKMEELREKIDFLFQEQNSKDNSIKALQQKQEKEETYEF